METFGAAIRKARKSHTCFGCGRIIPKGHQYERTCNSDGGEAWTCKMCAECLDYLTEVGWHEEDSFCHGELKWGKESDDWDPTDPKTCHT